jgi:hypothetical protein
VKAGYTRGYGDIGYKGCSNERQHTPHPIGYLQDHAWMREMSKTHKQTQCPECGRYAIWVPKPAKKPRKR